MGKIVLALGILLLATGGAQAALPVTEKTIRHKDATFEIDIRYPQTGNAAIDKVLGDFVKGAAGYVHPDQPPDEENAKSVTVDYTVYRNDDKIFGVRLDGGTYHQGAAHPMPIGHYFTFLMPSGRQVFLPELVDGPRGMKKVSQLAIPEIFRELGKSGPPLPPEEVGNIERRAGPAYLEGTDFKWLPDELVLVFGSYELLGYIGGPIVHIPMTALADVLRADPSAPAASFDCRGAQSAIEKTLCTDVELARLDRHLASRYAVSMQTLRELILFLQNKPSPPSDWDRKYLADDQAKLDGLIAGQRAWLAERNKTCATGEEACLTAHYQARLKAL